MLGALTLESSGAAAAATAGHYEIVASNAIGTGLSNYTITYVNGLLTVNNKPVQGPDSNIPSVYNGMMINDGTQFQTLTSWRNSIDSSSANSIDNNEGFEYKAVEGIGLALDSLIIFADTEYSVSDGEYTLSNPSDNNFFMDGEYAVGEGSEYIGGAGNVNQEFNSQFDGLIDLSLNFEGEDSLINFEAIAAYEDRHPLFKTELDKLLDKVFG